MTFLLLEEQFSNDNLIYQGKRIYPDPFMKGNITDCANLDKKNGYKWSFSVKEFFQNRFNSTAFSSYEACLVTWGKNDTCGHEVLATNYTSRPEMVCHSYEISHSHEILSCGHKVLLFLSHVTGRALQVLEYEYSVQNDSTSSQFDRFNSNPQQQKKTW